MNNNQVIVANFDFQLLDSNISIWKNREVDKDDSLVFLKELDFAIHVAGDDGRSAARFANQASVADDYKDYDKVYKQAKQEFERTGKIKGFEVLNLRSLEKLWLSHYDFYHLIKGSKL